MHFSHLVQVNATVDPSVTLLSREQLWQGLVKRAEKPLYFVYGLDECHILNRGPDSMLRELRFGSLTVHDRVYFVPPNEVRYEIEPSATMPGGTLTMRIEEPQPGELFVRFDYELKVQSGRVEDYYNEFRKSAYVEADIDTVRAIRELAEQGWL